MLESLYIKNYAIIDEIEMIFDPHFNVITGETGAGKSILIGALGLILGARADSKVLYQSQTRCIVEATFKLDANTLSNLPHSDDYDLSEETVLRREINHTGKSRAFVNDSLVRLSSLKNLAIHLVEIHNQFDSLSIITPEYQLSVVDALSNNKDLISKYQSAYSTYKSLKTELTALVKQQSKSNQDMDYLLYQLDELDKIDLDNLDKEWLEKELKTLLNSEEIKRILARISAVISEADPSVEDQLIDLLKEVHAFSDFNPKIHEISELLNESIELLREAQSQSSNLFGDLNFEPERLTELRDTLDHLYLLENKHKVTTVEGLIEIRDMIRSRTEGTHSLEELIAQKQNALAKAKSVLSVLAEKLTESRKKQFDPICRELERMLVNLAMPNAQLQLRHSLLTEFAENGRDLVSLYFSANKGIEPQAVSDIASGGEISRLALSVKSLIASHIKIDTLIFDEIDTGISGAVAIKVAEILKKLAGKHQVISITHSPQVAANARRQFFVHKRDTSDRTLTEVRILSADERVEEIAKMLSTDPPSNAALKNASELLAM